MELTYIGRLLWTPITNPVRFDVSPGEVYAVALHSWILGNPVHVMLLEIAFHSAYVTVPQRLACTR